MPAVFLAFANDWSDRDRHLRSLRGEGKAIGKALAPLVKLGLEVLPAVHDATLPEVLDEFREHHDQIRVFHFGGHATGSTLLLEDDAGVLTAAHANGLVFGVAGASPRMWLARRSPYKAIDPGLLDNLVGGGIAEAEDPASTLRREAWEEAGIAAVDVAEPIATLTIQRPVPDGWQHETIFAYDLRLPDDFMPNNQDGEAVEHRLVDVAEAARLMTNVEGADVMTIDATLVAFDCLARHGSPAPIPAQRNIS